MQRDHDQRILVVDDDPDSVVLIQKHLTKAGYEVITASDGHQAMRILISEGPLIVITDWMMPGMDGLAVLKALRATNSQIPVIFLTGMADVDDRVEGLMAGGDDYLVKPFHFSELIARITALSRRPGGREEKTTLKVHDLELDLLTRTARRGDTEIDLLAKEFALLEILMRNEGRVVTKTMLLEQVWDFNFDPRTTVVETHISRLRAKVDKPFDVPLIHTTRNSGYSLYAPR